jgi:hypothetical protein
MVGPLKNIPIGKPPDPSDNRIVPIIGSGVFSAGVLGTFMPISTYLIDAFQLYAASALAANTVLRSLTGALLPLAGPKMVLPCLCRLIVVCNTGFRMGKQCPRLHCPCVFACSISHLSIRRDIANEMAS